MDGGGDHGKGGRARKHAWPLIMSSGVARCLLRASLRLHERALFAARSLIYVWRGTVVLGFSWWSLGGARTPRAMGQFEISLVSSGPMISHLPRDPCPLQWTHADHLLLFLSFTSPPSFYPSTPPSNHLFCSSLTLPLLYLIMGDSSASYIHMVQHLIEKCLLYCMSKEECMEALNKHANIKPVITATVWAELEKENMEFFAAYAKEREVRRLESEAMQRIKKTLAECAARFSDDGE